MSGASEDSRSSTETCATDRSYEVEDFESPTASSIDGDVGALPYLLDPLQPEPQQEMVEELGREERVGDVREWYTDPPQVVKILMNIKW